MNSGGPKRILVINPGSTSTKLAIFSGAKKILQDDLVHDSRRLRSMVSIWDQYELRLSAVNRFLQKNDSEGIFDAIVGRGGLLKPVKRGTYLVDETMLSDAKTGVQGEHVSNLGCALAHETAARYGCNAYIVDPVSVDEFEPIAYISGHPKIRRRSLSHALNLRATALWAAEKLEKTADKTQFVVAHLGGGISVAPVKGGRILDVNDASSDGPFSPERSGGLPLLPLVDLCFSGLPKTAIKKMILGEGGIYAYLGTRDIRVVERRIDCDDQDALLIYTAMAYQIAKEIAAMSSVLFGQVDAIILTGGLAHSSRLVKEIRHRIEFIAPVLVNAGEQEMEAMAAGVLRVLAGRETAKHYR